MAARVILSEVETLFRRNKRFEQFRLMHIIQLLPKSPNNSRLDYVKSRCSVLSSSNLILTSYNLNFLTLLRWKYGKKEGESKIVEYDSDDENRKGNEDPEVLSIVAYNKNAKIINSTVNSMRIDAIVKAGMAISRNKAEAAVYEGKLRVNGTKPLKKGLQIRIGDVIDLVHGISPENDKFLLVTRVTILNANIHDDNYKIKILREKSLTIENYDDVWNPIK